MKNINVNRIQIRKHRHQRILKRLRVNNSRLRARITKSNAHIYVQVLDDLKNITITSSSSLQLKLKNGNKENATLVGKDLATKLHELKINEIIFDRGGCKYHGRVSAVAEALRANGIKF